MVKQAEKLTISDWLPFLETRSSNYISALSIGASAVAIVVSISGLSAKLELYKILIILVATLVALQALASWMLGRSILVEVIETKEISDRIVTGELDTVEKIQDAWQKKETSLLKWFYKKLRQSFSVFQKL